MNHNLPTIGFNKTITQEDDYNNKGDKGKDVIKKIISNFDDDNVESEYFSPNKRVSNIQYPKIMNNLKTLDNINISNNNEINNDKYSQNDFKNFKNQKRYGKKLINVLRRKNDNKKD